MIIAIITLGSIITWAVTARALFRRWVRNETFARKCRRDHLDGYCSRNRENDMSPRYHGTVAGYAVVAALFLPVIAFAAFIMHNPPLSRNALEARTRTLEAENVRLRQEQDGSRKFLGHDYGE